MFDKDSRLVVCNDQYGAMYGLGPEQTKPGTNLRSILEARGRAGMLSEDAAEYIRTRTNEVARGDT